MPSHALYLSAITLAAAIVNGAVGYGFSSITVPLALLFLTNRTLNPALVLVEVVLNANVLWVNRASFRLIWRRTLPVIVGLLPGIAAGTAIVSMVNPSWLKLATLSALLPIVLIQASGIRRPVQSERRIGVAFGSALGVLYSVTTISGPPLALALNNQGLTAQEFRAAIGLIRLFESSVTAVAYLLAGLYSRDSVSLVPFILPSVLIGVPLGAVVLRRVGAETFRRVCMSVDAWIVSFGISTLLSALGLMPGAAAWSVMAAVVVTDAWLLYRFFRPTPR